MTPGSRARGPRRTVSMRARWRGCCGRGSWSRCGGRMSAVACCGAGWRGASSWCIRARARRTRFTPCCSAGCRASRRVLICSGVKGRRWLAGLELPVEERESVDAGVRHVEFLDSEIAAVERLIARQALEWPEIRRLMTVPGVNLICAATFIAAIGHAGRFLMSRKLVAYLGLDPRVRQSGEAPARSGKISKRGSAAARWALVEAAWSVVLQPGPLHAFYDRTRARRGHGKAIVATARKLAILFWCMLTRGEDYAHQQPSLTKKKLRRLELTAGAPKHAKTARGVWSSNLAIRHAERELAQQAEASYKRLVTDQQAAAPARKVGASATPERA